MFYKSQFYTPTKIKKKIQFKNFFSGMNGGVDDKLKSPTTPELSFNFNPFNGSLKGAEGLSVLKFNGVEYTLPNNLTAKQIYFYKRFDNVNKVSDDRLVCYASDGYIYQCKLNSETGNFLLVPNCYFAKAPLGICYNYYGSDVLILAYDNNQISILDDNTVTTYQDTPQVSSMCIHKERLFLTSANDVNTVWFSGNFNPVDWAVSLDGAGYVTIPDERGKMLKVVSFYDYVYLFREYGITRISAYGDQTEFIVDNLFLKHGKIYKNSITTCGNYIVFLASDGIYRFDGANSTKILSEYDSYFVNQDNSNSNGAFFDNKLYLSLNMKFDGVVEKVILVYDFLNKYSYLLKGLNVKSFLSVSGEEYYLLAVTNDGKIVKIDNSGMLYDKPLKKVFKTIETDFGIDNKNKRLYKFTIETDTEIKVIINCDGDNFYYKMNKYDNVLDLDIKGDLFSVTIINEMAKARIVLPTLYFSYSKESL